MTEPKPDTASGLKIEGPYLIHVEDAGTRCTACLHAAESRGIIDPVPLIFHLGYAAASGLFNMGLGLERAEAALRAAEREGRPPVLLVVLSRDDAVALLALGFEATAAKVAKGDPCFVIVDEGANLVRLVPEHLAH